MKMAQELTNQTCLFGSLHLKCQHLVNPPGNNTSNGTSYVIHPAQPLAKDAHCDHVQSKDKKFSATIPLSNKKTATLPTTKEQTLKGTCAKVSPESANTYVEPSEPAKVDSSVLSFEVKGVLGKGAFATVLLAHCKQSGSLYALKRMKLQPPEDRDKELYRAILKQELRALLLNAIYPSPFLLSLKTWLVADEHIYLATDFFNGGNLAQLRKEFPPNNRLPEHIVQFYCAEMAVAIGQVHQQHLLHRDIKLDNFLISHNGHIVLADFGLSTSDPETNVCGGTYKYMAPERLDNKPYGTASDWWSLAICIYTLLFGKHPTWNDSASTQYNIYDLVDNEIKVNEVDYVRNPYAYSFLRQMLIYEPEFRLGHGEDGFKRVLDHPYIVNFDRSKLFRQELVPPTTYPHVKGPQDFSQIKFSELDMLMDEVPSQIVAAAPYHKELQVALL